MSKEQIEEMAKDLCDIECKGMKCGICDSYGCEYRMQAESYAFQYGTVTDKQAIINHERAEVAREIEKFEQQVGKIYNRYVFEDTDYADDDVAIEAVINALTDVLNDLADFKKKYTEGEG